MSKKTIILLVAAALLLFNTPMAALANGSAKCKPQKCKVAKLHVKPVCVNKPQPPVPSECRTLPDCAKAPECAKTPECAKAPECLQKDCEDRCDCPEDTECPPQPKCECLPGWGLGDDNHCHFGPPGHGYTPDNPGTFPDRPVD